ncbi:MAG TPA: DUF4332 domain-containing protein [Methanosarcinales archaeon]|nr:DUF4332 domain-containing protein [Methanosarcinales archaeon]
MPDDPKIRTSRTARTTRVAGTTSGAAKTTITKQQLEADIKIRDDLITSLQAEKLEVASKSEVLEERVRKLDRENMELNEKIRKLQISRPTMSSARLVSSFRDALDDMQASLISEKGGAKYHVSEIKVNLKANLSCKNDQILIQLPKPDDIIPSENLSTINFRIRATPTTEVDTSEYIDVPNLIGLDIEMGKSLILSKGFVIGEIEYIHTDKIVSGMVVGQMPSPFSVAPPGGPIDLTISKHPGVNVPNFLGLSLDEAKNVADGSELTIGGTSFGVSESPEGTVISQSIKVGETVEPGTSVDLVIAKKREIDETETYVKEIANIGEYNSDKLDDVGIITTSDLESAPLSVICKATGVSKGVAEEWKRMAMIHNKEMGSHGAYILVKTGFIKSVEDLKNADPSKLYNAVKKAISGGRVRVPPGFSLNKDDISRWIKGAMK